MNISAPSRIYASRAWQKAALDSYAKSTETERWTGGTDVIRSTHPAIKSLEIPTKVNGLTPQDPEFSPVSNAAVFQDVDNQVWMGQVDPKTGKMTADATPIGQTINLSTSFQGPEFGLDQNGEAVFWSGENEDGDIVTYRAEPGSNSAPQELDSGIDMTSVIVSKNPQAEETLLMTREVGTNDWYVFSEESPDQLTSVPLANPGTQGPQFYPDESAVLTNEVDGHGDTQLVRFDIETGETTTLTTDSGSKSNASFFTDPKTGEQMLMAVVDGEELTVYEELPDGTYQAAYSYDSPDGRITSPETTVYEDEVYFSFAASHKDGPGSTIYLMDSEGEAIAVSKSTAKRRLDPETVVPEEGIQVNYFTVGPRAKYYTSTVVPE